MKYFASVVVLFGLLTLSCKRTNTTVQTNDFEQRVSGRLALGPAAAIVVQNQFGSVILNQGQGLLF